MQRLLYRSALALLVFASTAACDQGAVPSRPGLTQNGDPTVPTTPTDPTTPTTPTDPATPTDPTTPTEHLSAVQLVAKAALTAWRATDLSTLASLSPARAQEALSGLTADSARFLAMFGADGWRAAAVAAWDGALTPVRTLETRSLVRFADLAGGAVAAVDLRFEGGQWRFYNLLRVDGADFASFGDAGLAP